MNSGYSWVVYRSGQCEEYVDAKKEMHANWMRYVNCARNDEEQNLVAFQYRGGILYRCCRPIDPGQELMVWYEEEYAKDLCPAFDCLWNKKCSADVNDCLMSGAHVLKTNFLRFLPGDALPDLHCSHLQLLLVCGSFCLQSCLQ
ncbi:hypothetical protein PDJAM_G00207030 [Pangasius djambal]|uniref:Uncharacterized protein n=1 Tax=Pangasius djambal TaxID=1691987 RepID=A0ACC5Y8W7_9TELE|nr:hypothetical protein [Pangasius djambal]